MNEGMEGDFGMKKICAAAVIFMLLLALCTEASADTFVLPADLTEIGEEAFFGVEGIEEAVLPAGITRIGDRAFAQSSLERIILPENVPEIGIDAFPEDAVVFVFGNGAELRERGFNLVTCSLTEGDTVCITGYSGSKAELEIPESLAGYTVTRIGDGAFSGNTALTDIIVPLTLTEIGDEAFLGCSSLSRPWLPLGLTSIGDRAFYGVSGVSVNVPRSVTHIGADAFTGYRYLNVCPGTYSYEWALAIQDQNPSVMIASRYIARIVTSADVAAKDEQVTCTALILSEDIEAFQWQISTDGGVTWTDIEGADDTEYTFTASLETCGLYRVAGMDFTGTYYSTIAQVSYLNEDIAIRSAYVCGTDISLDWTKEPEGVLYTLFMTGPDGMETVVAEDLWDPFFDVTGLEPETAYAFRVSASYGEATVESASVTVTTQNYRTGTVCRALLIGEVTFGSDFEDCPDSIGDLNLFSSMLRHVTGPDGNPWSYVRMVDLTSSEIHQAIQTTFADADEDDISLFFIATHGCEEGDEADIGGLYAYSRSYWKQDLIRDTTLAAWLSEVPGQVIVLLEACSSGSAIQDPDALNAAAANAAVIRAFRNADRSLALEGERIFFAPEEEQTEGPVSRMGALRQSKFRVLTSSAHLEYSYGYTEPDFPHTLFTYGLTLGVGLSGPMPCDTNGDGQASLAELQRYITDFHDPQYLNVTQHVQAYPANSDDALFYRIAQ
jgi:opacity protein-like surface antigen